MYLGIHLVPTVRDVSFGKLLVSQAMLLDFVFYLKKTFFPSWRDLNCTLMYFGHLRGWGVTSYWELECRRYKAESTSNSELSRASVIAEKMEMGETQPGLGGWCSLWSKSQKVKADSIQSSIYSLNKQIQCLPETRQRYIGEQTPPRSQSHSVCISKEGKITQIWRSVLKSSRIWEPYWYLTTVLSHEETSEVNGWAHTSSGRVSKKIQLLIMLIRGRSKYREWDDDAGFLDRHEVGYTGTHSDKHPRSQGNMDLVRNCLRAGISPCLPHRGDPVPWVKKYRKCNNVLLSCYIYFHG